MKILFYCTSGGDGSAIAFHVKQFENQDVYLYFDKPYAKNLLKGYVPQIDSMNEIDKIKPDLIVFDSVGKGIYADKLKKEGYKVLGASRFCDELEYNRKFGLELMKSTGIKIPVSKEFTSFEEVQKEVLATNKRYVLKPEGIHSPETTFVAQNAEEMYRYVEYLKKLPVKGKLKLILQEFIDGIEISNEMWFANGKPVYPANWTIELKRRDVDDLGPIMGCAASVVSNYNSKEPRIVQKVFKKIFLLFEKIKYSGPVDINTIVTKNGDIYGLEWTPRLGYNACFCFFELLKIPISEFFMKIVSGEISEIPHIKEFGYCVRVFTSPAPVDLPSIDDNTLIKEIRKSKNGIPVIWDNEDLPHIWPYDIEKSVEGPVVSGTDLQILEISSKGKTIEEAKSNAVKIFDRTLIPNKSARIRDSIEIAVQDYPDLVNMNFIK